MSLIAIKGTGLRAYMVNILCTIQVYNYLPKNVSGVCAYITREKI